MIHNIQQCILYHIKEVRIKLSSFWIIPFTHVLYLFQVLSVE